MGRVSFNAFFLFSHLTIPFCSIGVKGDDAGPSTEDAAIPAPSVDAPSTSGAGEKEEEKKAEDEEEEVDESEIVLSLEDLEEASYKEYEAGGYSPPRITDPDKLLELRVRNRLIL